VITCIQRPDVHSKVTKIAVKLDKLYIFYNNDKVLCMHTFFLAVFLLSVNCASPKTNPLYGPPVQAAAAGYTRLGFDEEFNGPLDIGYGTPGQKWNAGLWWESIPSASRFIADNGSLTITATATSNVNLCTQFHDYSGGTYFKGGYFEAKMRCTDWSAFWLYSANRPRVWGNAVNSNPMTQTAEIDIVETDPGFAFSKTVVNTIHKNTGGDGGIPDVQNPNNNNVIGAPVCNAVHTYGALWTPANVTWYVDNMKVCTYPTFPSTWQPMQLILSAQPGGVNGSASTSIPPTTIVYWVRVWQKPGLSLRTSRKAVTHSFECRRGRRNTFRRRLASG
jgi:beta-glucanase (GH16 family)